MKRNRKLAIALVVIIVFVISIICIQIVTQKSKTNEQSGLIYLYGEEHASEVILEEEFELWNTYYHDNGMRDLFIELPYYSAEFLNLWMKSDNDDILEQLYRDWEGTAIHSQVVLDFYKQIKSECPETVFHGTDVGHQYQSTGERYLAYLQETGQSSSSEQYQLAIEQGQHYYQYSDDVYRENTMTENFIREFDRLNGVDVMGIYGAAHIGIDALDYTTNTIPCMANQLHERYGDAVHAEDLTLVHDAYTVDTVQIGEKEYSASYFGKTDLSAILPDYQCREFWRLENAYDDFKDCPTTGNVLPYDNYPMEIDVGQIFMIKYTKADGSVITEYHRSDGHAWRGELATEEFSIEG